MKHLWRRAIEEGDEAKATVIATVANLLSPEIKLAAGAEVPAKTADATVTVHGQAVDLAEMEDQDARDYAAYAKEMDGTAARERHIADLEERDEEDRRIGVFHDGS